MSEETFKTYAKEISRIKFLEQDQEREIFIRAERGEKEELKKIAEAYQHLVFSTALSFKQNIETTLELIQEGNIGLLESIERFDYKSGTAFSIYALPRIKGSMINYLKKQPKKDKELSLETPLEEDYTIGETIKSDEPEVIEIIEAKETRETIRKKINETMDKLPEKEKQTIYMIHIMMQDPKKVAETIGVSTGTIYKYQKTAIRRMRGSLARTIGKLRTV